MKPIIHKKNIHRIRNSQQIIPIDDTIIPRTFQSDYTTFKTAKLIFNKKNVDHVNEMLRQAVLKKYNINIGLQQPVFIEEWLHEAYYNRLEENRLLIYNNQNSIINLNKIGEYEYDYFKDENRLIINSKDDQGRIKQNMRNIIKKNAKGLNQQINLKTLTNVVEDVNARALKLMLDVVDWRLGAYLNYQKMYNLRPIDIVAVTGWNRRPQTESDNSERKDNYYRRQIIIPPDFSRLPKFGFKSSLSFSIV